MKRIKNNKERGKYIKINREKASQNLQNNNICVKFRELNEKQ